jgi:hypothetical protein
LKLSTLNGALIAPSISCSLVMTLSTFFASVFWTVAYSAALNSVFEGVASAVVTAGGEGVPS